MDIELTKTQKESVEYEGGDLLVKGLPGSGKSVVLMQRAMRFNKKAIDANERKRIVILTFTGSLVKYTKELVDITGLHPCMIEISTVDKICFDLYRKATKKRFVNVLSKNQDRIAVIDRAIQNHLDRVKEKHRFHDIDAEFWADEFLWIKQKCLTTAEAYIESERTGRGGKVRMTKADKAVAYELFTEYQTLLNKSSRLDWEDLYIYLLQNLEKINEADRYDYVLVDEAQDLSYVKLKIAKHLARRSITIAADKAQKIYSTSFSWKELGIDIRGRASKSLDSTFRSTKQIVQLAESLLEVNRALQEDQSEYTDPVYPTREGALPQVISCTDAADERDFVLELIKTHLNANEVIGVLYRSYSERLRICKWFANEGLAYQEIKKELPWSLNQPGIKLSTLHTVVFSVNSD